MVRAHDFKANCMNSIFLDRNPQVFAHILDYLRNERPDLTLSNPDMN